MTGLTMLNWLDTWLGLGNASGGQYLWWSGFFADVQIFAAAVIFYLHHQCSEKRCWRVAHHQVDGTHYKTCHLHASKTHHWRLQKRHKHEHPDMHELLGNRFNPFGPNSR